MCDFHVSKAVPDETLWRIYKDSKEECFLEILCDRYEEDVCAFIARSGCPVDKVWGNIANYLRRDCAREQFLRYSSFQAFIFEIAKQETQLGESTMITDPELLNHYRETKDERALDALLARYETDLTEYVTRKLASRHQNSVEDVMQEIRTALAKTMIPLLTGSSLRPLLFKIARFRCQAFLRDSIRNLDDVASLSDFNPDEIGQDPQRVENYRFISEMFATLPKHLADVLRLIDLAGHTAESAAKFLGLPITTIAYYHKEGLSRLRSRFACA